MELDLGRFCSDVSAVLTRLLISLSWFNATCPNVTEVVS